MSLRSRAGALLLVLCFVSRGGIARGAQNALAEAQRDYSGGRYHRAIDSLTAAIGASPNDGQLHFLLGQCYYQLREFTRATASFERSVQLGAEKSEYHDWLGKAYGRRAEEAKFLNAMGWARKTHKEFENAVALNPSNFEAQRDLIRFEMYAPGVVGGGDDRAVRHIEELEKIDPLHGELARGEFFTVKKHFAEADALFAKILASHTNRIGVYFEVADYYRDRHVPGQAAEQNTTKYREAIAAAERIDPADRRLKYYQGVLLVMEGKNPAEAETLLNTYVATVPDNADVPSHASALEWLAKSYEGQGRFSQAVEQYRASLALDPQNKSVEEALRRLQKK